MENGARSQIFNMCDTQEAKKKGNTVCVWESISLSILIILCEGAQVEHSFCCYGIMD